MFTAGAQAVHDDGLFELDKNAVDDAGGGGSTGTTSSQVHVDATTGGRRPGIALGAVECCVCERSGRPLDLHDRWFEGRSRHPELAAHGRNRPAEGRDPGRLRGEVRRHGGEEILYFGADRFAQNGSADFGFWFFRSEVSITRTGRSVATTRQPALRATSSSWAPSRRVGRPRTSACSSGSARAGTRLPTAPSRDRPALSATAFGPRPRPGLRHRQRRAHPRCRGPIRPRRARRAASRAGGFVEGGINLSDARSRGLLPQLHGGDPLVPVRGRHAEGLRPRSTSRPATRPDDDADAATASVALTTPTSIASRTSIGTGSVGVKDSATGRERIADLDAAHSSSSSAGRSPRRHVHHGGIRGSGRPVTKHVRVPARLRRTDERHIGRSLLLAGRFTSATTGVPTINSDARSAASASRFCR